MTWFSLSLSLFLIPFSFLFTKGFEESKSDGAAGLGQAGPVGGGNGF